MKTLDALNAVSRNAGSMDGDFPFSDDDENFFRSKKIIEKCLNTKFEQATNVKKLNNALKKHLTAAKKKKLRHHTLIQITRESSSYTSGEEKFKMETTEVTINLFFDKGTRISEVMKKMWAVEGYDGISPTFVLSDHAVEGFDVFDCLYDI